MSSQQQDFGAPRGGQVGKLCHRLLETAAINHEGILLFVVLRQNRVQGGPGRFRYMQEYDMQVILLLLFHATPPYSISYAQFSRAVQAAA